VEQAGTVGKRRAVPGHDRPPLDPIFRSGSKIAALKCAIWTEFSLVPCEGSLWSPSPLQSAQPAPIRRIDTEGPLKVERAAGKFFSSMSAPEKPQKSNQSPQSAADEKCHPADPPGGSRPAGIGGDSFSMPPQMKRQPA
jgi:hypothetical protein